MLAAVHHAEVVAHRVGEPFGTLVLALAVTVIEVALIVSLMLAAGEAAAALARDTIFAAIMIILNGMVGLCLLVGGSRHGEQIFGLYGVNAALATLATMAVVTLVLPNTTTTIAGPMYSASQLALIAVASLVLYASFVLVQTVRHRDYFLPQGHAAQDAEAHAVPPNTRAAALSAALLLACLGAVVLLAKAIAPTIEAAIDAAGAPKAVVGIIIAAIVLLPESLAALQAARVNRLQTSLNLALGSALASIGLDHSSGRRGHPRDRLDAGARARSQRDGASGFDTSRRDAVPRHRSNDHSARRRPSRDLRRLPVHDGRALI